MAPVAGRYEDLIESRTRWWPSYQSYGFVLSATPRETFGSYVRDVFARPQKLMRSVSASSLSSYRDTDDLVGLGLKKSPSYTSLSPSYALPYDCRVATRYISNVKPAKVQTDNWYLKTYTPYNFNRTMSEQRPVRTYSPYLGSATTHLAYYPYRDSYYNVDKWSSYRNREMPSSYLRQSCYNMRSYVQQRLKHDEYSLPYVRDSYERPTYAERYMRFYRGGQSNAYVGTPLSLPVFERSRQPHRVYEVRHRLPFHPRF